MKTLILMAVEKAQRMSDAELAAEIKRLQSGETKLFARDEQDLRVPLSSLILSALKRVQLDRQQR